MLPTGTYRVQVRPDFPLTATAELADYLADLGVSHLYTAPLLTAAPDSQHGYDVECALLQSVQLDTRAWTERERTVVFLLSGVLTDRAV